MSSPARKCKLFDELSTNSLNTIFVDLLKEMHKNYAQIVQNQKANGGCFNLKEFQEKMQNLINSIVKECNGISDEDKIKATPAYQIIEALKTSSNMINNNDEESKEEKLHVGKSDLPQGKKYTTIKPFSRSKILNNLQKATAAIKEKSTDTSPVLISALKLLACVVACVLGATAGFFVGGPIGAGVGVVAAGAVAGTLCFGYDKCRTKSVAEASEEYLAEVKRAAKATL